MDADSLTGPTPCLFSFLPAFSPFFEMALGPARKDLASPMKVARDGPQWPSAEEEEEEASRVARYRSKPGRGRS